jgi:SAM-dependent methyltransferase
VATSRAQASDWNEVFRTGPGGALWRRHSDAVNRRLVDQWLQGRHLHRVLKTDLWDEAVADGVAPALAVHADEVDGMDVASMTVAAAVARHPWLTGTVADVRDLPMGDDEYDAVLSLSTLDHLPGREAVEAGVEEIARVLRPGGELLMTFDNGANPAVALRNALTPRMRRATGLVPYPVEVALGQRALVALVRRVGFHVLDVTAALHCPRVLSVRSAARADRRGVEASDRLAVRLLRWEALEALPTRQITGHFVVVRARKL